MNCINCGDSIEESKSKDLAICLNCFEVVMAFEKSTIRKKIVEVPSKITDKIFLGGEHC